MHLLTVPLPIFRRALHDLQQRPARPIRWPVGLSRWAGHVELLTAVPGREIGRVILLSWADTFAVPSELPPDCAGVLLLGAGQHRGRARGIVRLPAYPQALLDGIRLVGPGMQTIALRPEHGSESFLGGEEGGPADRMVRWSRTIGALGVDVWQRLVRLRYGIIGVGRTGSRLALALAGLGVHALTLIDPDTLALPNLGEMAGVTDADLERPKVEAVATALTAVAPTPLALVCVPTSITRQPALRAAQACDVLLSCVDHDSARLAATAMATLYCKPLLDIATGVHGHGPRRQMGIDVRLVLPGRCLLCWGGLRDMATARQVLASAEAERLFYKYRNWQDERAGSLASLNQCALGIAQRLLEDLIAARVQDSMWVRLEFDAAGRLAVSYPMVPTTSDVRCPLCRLGGWGEEGVPRLGAWLRQEREWKSRGTGDTTHGTER